MSVSVALEVIRTCLPHLLVDHGAWFREYVPLSGDGSVVGETLSSGSIDLGVIPESDTLVYSPDVVPLVDDRAARSFGNVAPVVRQGAVPPEGRAVLDAVSAALTTLELDSMSSRYASNRASVGSIADRFLRVHGIEIGRAHV